jgi:hypothetical protein
MDLSGGLIAQSLDQAAKPSVEGGSFRIVLEQAQMGFQRLLVTAPGWTALTGQRVLGVLLKFI